ncbi:helix-turn-helix domain-containing protein [Arsenicibacter rosenii]|uniref:Helix-turn-helix domain-containing protein n=1 Tax=Arsenicibacter rosenii TaxID=1750698 RepID=A0A1S2VIG2_9BACT|nr:helix-turn-helix domain-containing protein [Arsenicibacter rosenii]OIN58006.1 hypothetical protein BLX24_15830 [Arsenicibacter rosenii]
MMKKEGEITVEEVVVALFALKEFVPKMDQVISLLSLVTENDKELDKHFTTEELSDYLPGKPAVSTLRNKFQRREIPGRKVGKRIVFLKSEIDQWLKGERPAMQVELQEQAEAYLNSRQTKRKKNAAQVASGRASVNRRRA